MKVLTVIGARPQFVKAAVVSRAFRERPEIDEQIVHTGQHYDERMSQLFFDELEIPRPRYNLQVGSGPHGEQTGRMLAELERVLIQEPPDVVLVYGDTNSTLAGALAAVKRQVPVAHVEAGLRSYNRKMPEEINRLLTDRISSLLLCPTRQAVENLVREGISEGVHLVGDVMYDSALHFAELAASRRDPLSSYQLRRGDYVLMTCHRAENADDPARLCEIMRAAACVSESLPVFFPVHPRTRHRLEAQKARIPAGVQLVEPVSYLEMLILLQHAAVVLTDSGGLQKEAFMLGVPCVTMRDETEWGETTESGANILAGADTRQIVAAIQVQRERIEQLPDAGDFYGQGQASGRIADLIAELDAA